MAPNPRRVTPSRADRAHARVAPHALDRTEARRDLRGGRAPAGAPGVDRQRARLRPPACFRRAVSLVGRKLVVLHVDGVSADSLEQGLGEGDMPFVQHLIDSEGYQVLRYRCGVPSTTPFAQAGILYGDNSEIPSFRWWDRERRVLVQFGAGSTFEKVADKYFGGCMPLTNDGACIAACYPAGAADDFGIAYQDRTYGQQSKSRSAAA
ncbi:MAG: hypothetical protein E6J20_06420, partial [Chloroflexi bacterium]